MFQIYHLRPIHYNASRIALSIPLQPVKQRFNASLLRRPRLYATAAHPIRRPRGRWFGRSLVIVGATWALYQVLYYRSDGRSSTDPIPFEGINSQTFTPFVLVRKDIVSPTSAIFSLRASSASNLPSSSPSISSTSPTATTALHTNTYGHEDPFASLFAKGLWSLEFKQPQLQIARSYTPLPPLPLLSASISSDSQPTVANNELRFLIRKEHRGEMSSNYLDRLPVGSTIELRGPKIEFEVPQSVEEVVFLAGGTGIAPALQAVHTLLSGVRDETDVTPTAGAGKSKKKPKVRILWANRRREDCLGCGSKRKSSGSGGLASWLWASPYARKIPNDEESGIIVQELQRLEALHGENLKVDYFVDEETFITKKAIVKALRPCKRGRGKAAARLDKQPLPGAKLVMVSGPEGFIKCFAGPKAWEEGKEIQGPVGGVLGRLMSQGFMTDWKVVKI